MTSRRARLRPLLAATALLAAGCSYGYDNPAQVLGTGEVAGRVVAESTPGGPLAGVPNVQVELRNSYNAATSRDTGRFFLFGLMPGRHTVLFSRPPDLSLQRDVEMAFGADGQPEGVILGDLRLRRSVTIQAKVLAPFVPGFDGFEASSATVTDEATGQQLDLLFPPGNDGSFTFAFTSAPTGPHRIRTAVTGLPWSVIGFDGLGAPIRGYGAPVTVVGGPPPVNIPETSEGLKIDLTDAATEVPSPVLTGKLRFKAAIAGATSAGGFTVSVEPLPFGSGAPVAPSPDSTGAYELDLTPGLYAVTVTPPVGAGSLLGPPLGRAVVLEGQTAELGTFYAVDLAAISEAHEACLVTADCPSGTCQGGRCALAACLPGDFSVECASAISSCFPGSPVTCAGGAGTCGGSSVDPVCVPKGAAACALAGVTWSACDARPN